jgi:hypothetical protein
MSAPKAVKLDATMATDFYVSCESEHVVEYKLWIYRADESKWYPIGPEQTNDDASDHWIFMPPMKDGSILAYWLGIWGHANTHWVARIEILQRGSDGGDWIERAAWTEEGDTNDQGNGGGVATIPDIPQVKLTV